MAAGIRQYEYLLDTRARAEPEEAFVNLGCSDGNIIENK